MSDTAIQTVVLTVQYSARLSYYLDWLDGFVESPLFAVTHFNLFHGAERRAARAAIETADLIVALHGCTADTLEFIRPLSGALQARRGQLLMLIGNEYNSPWMPLGEKRRFAAEVGADFIGTQLLLEAGEWLYEGTGAQVLALPHALNDAAFRRVKDDAARRIDIGGRSARYPAFLGDDERNRLYAVFAGIGAETGMVIDIDGNNGGRFERPDWADFLNDCRGTLGSEAGSPYLERDDRLVLEIREFLRQRGGTPMLRVDGLAHSLGRRLPFAVKAKLRGLLKWMPLRHEAVELADAEFAEIRARFFDGRPAAPAYSKCISSRHFDAAGTGTCQLLVRGRYNDILTADEHYLAFEPDLANGREVIARFRDPGERKRIADNAYVYIHDAHTYSHRLAALHSALMHKPPVAPAVTAHAT